jgi:hypothetical protein
MSGRAAKAVRPRNRRLLKEVEAFRFIAFGRLQAAPASLASAEHRNRFKAALRIRPRDYDGGKTSFHVVIKPVKACPKRGPLASPI